MSMLDLVNKSIAESQRRKPRRIGTPDHVKMGKGEKVKGKDGREETAIGCACGVRFPFPKNAEKRELCKEACANNLTYEDVLEAVIKDSRIANITRGIIQAIRNRKQVEEN